MDANTESSNAEDNIPTESEILDGLECTVTLGGKEYKISEPSIGKRRRIAQNILQKRYAAFEDKDATQPVVLLELIDVQLELILSMIPCPNSEHNDAYNNATELEISEAFIKLERLVFDPLEKQGIMQLIRTVPETKESKKSKRKTKTKKKAH